MEQKEGANGAGARDEAGEKGIGEDEPLYDIVIPPGTPRSIIIEISKKFDVEVVERKEKLSFANMEGEERELLAFRGKLPVMKEVEKYLVEGVRKFIGE
jgi:hypothetical protein